MHILFFHVIYKKLPEKMSFVEDYILQCSDEEVKESAT
jgi:hypothetical protein